MDDGTRSGSRDVLTGAAPFDALPHLSPAGIRGDDDPGVEMLLAQLEIEIGAWWSETDAAGDVVIGLATLAD